MTTRQLYEEYGLDENTRAFVGHAMALHTDDEYINQVSESLKLISILIIIIYPIFYSTL